MAKKPAKTSGLFDEIAGDAKRQVEANKLPSPKTLSHIGALLGRCQELEAAIALREQANKDDAEKLRKLYEETIPSVMNQAGTLGFTMTDGTVVAVEPFHYGEIVAEQKPAAFKWLRDNKHGDLIKEEVSIPAGRGNGKAVKAILAAAKKLGLVAEKTESVHHSTFRAFVREQMTAGKVLPEKLFRVHSGQKAVFKAPKQPKAQPQKQEKK